MGIAQAVRERADCRGQKVGAIIVVDDRIVSTGYNGTPTKMKNCSDGGCLRCANRDKTYKSGTAYDLCICVHAEQNAILSAARFGISVQGGTVYSTTQPCFGCLKEMLQARIVAVYYLHPWITCTTPNRSVNTRLCRKPSRMESTSWRCQIREPTGLKVRLGRLPYLMNTECRRHNRVEGGNSDLPGPLPPSPPGLLESKT